MTGWLFGAILFATIAAWVTLVTTGPGTRLRRGLLTCLAAAPLLLFGTVVAVAFMTAPAGEYRVALEAVSFRFTDDDTVTVGGGSSSENGDDLIVRDLPPHYLTFRLEGNGVAVYLPPDLDHDSEDPGYAAVRVDDQRPFANSILLGPGAKIAVGGRETRDFDIARRTIRSPAATYPPIPTRKQDVLAWSVPILKNLTAETAMYPLRYWARPLDSGDPATDRDGVPLGSFFSFDQGYFRRSLYLTLTGDGTAVTLPGHPTAHYETKVAVLDRGKEHHFALYRLDYADAAKGEDVRSLAQERRSFRASYTDGRLRIVFDTPDIVRVPPDAVRELFDRQKADDSFLMVTRDSRRNAPVSASQMQLSFRQLGRRLQNELFSAIKVAAKSGNCPLRVTTHTGTKCYELGDAFRIGDDSAAILRVTQTGIPWGIAATLFALFLLTLGWPPELGQDAGAAILISAAEMLLAIRLLIAFEGGILDFSTSPALWESLAVFAILPFTLRVALRFRDWQSAAERPSIRSCVMLYSRHILPRAAAVGAIVGLVLSRAHLTAATSAAVGVIAILLPLLAGVIGPRLVSSFAKLSDRRPLAKILLLGVAIAVARGLMWLGLGWKERIALGGFDLALTVLYLPAVFLFFALLWQRYAQVESSSRWSGRGAAMTVAALALGMLLIVVMPYLVRDSGSALVHTPAILLLFALPAFSRRVTVRTAALATPLMLLLLIHGAVLVFPRLRGAEDVAEPAKNPSYQRALASDSDAEEFVRARLLSTNELRLMSQLSPHQLEEAGTSKAEGLVAQRRMLDRYSGRGLAGAGYLHVPLALFRDTHLNDNLSAIHVLAPFGVVGGAGVIGLLAALAILAPFPALRRHLHDDSPPEEAVDARIALGLLSLWTFSIVGIYMFAANVGLVLFTGKNVYLLAAASKSDAVEGGVLLLLALLCLRPAGEKTP